MELRILLNLMIDIQSWLFQDFDFDDDLRIPCAIDILILDPQSTKSVMDTIVPRDTLYVRALTCHSDKSHADVDPQRKSM